MQYQESTIPPDIRSSIHSKEFNIDMDEKVRNFLVQPFPLWENIVTEYVVQETWQKLKTGGLNNIDEYTTARILHSSTIPVGDRIEIIKGEKGAIYLEAPSADHFGSFYEEHGLVIDSEENMGTQLVKLQGAISMLAQVKPILNCIELLVRSIQVIKQEDTEIDLSYSNPKIPFSIFVSVCEDNSPIANLRVAESILHEAMHLKLTLIESITPLLLPDTGNRYFSPWRDEKRPAHGVLHGLFVFRAIHDFYIEIKPLYIQSNEIVSFLDFRLKDIRAEINSLTDFPNNTDLTESGKLITLNTALLPSL